jgi:hypothetical protein
MVQSTGAHPDETFSYVITLASVVSETASFKTTGSEAVMRVVRGLLLAIETERLNYCNAVLLKLKTTFAYPLQYLDFIGFTNCIRIG